MSQITLSGELTIYQVASIKQTLLQGLQQGNFGQQPLELNMAEVSEVDGAGLQLLLALARSALEFGASVRLLQVPPPVAAMLAECGVAGRFTIVTEEAAQ